MEINWYPGHMARAKRLLQEQLSRVDVVIELCDARLPRSSRNPDLKRMTDRKQRILLLGKADLADPKVTEKWLAVFRAQGMTCAALDMNRQARQALSLIDRAAREAVERAAQRGIRKTVRAMIVGVPNVGKSTLINRLHGGAIAKVGDMPGVTRANQWVKVSPYLELMDTPGLLWPRLDDPLAARRLAYIAAIRDEVLDTAQLAIQLLTDMIAVARGYLDGAVLHDTVAAEAWLLRAIAREEPPDSARAMALLARRILGVAEPLSDADYLAIRRRLPSAVGREREELEELLRLGSRRQQDLAEDDNLTLQR